MTEILTHGKISISVQFDTVSISVDCGDAYCAQTLFDEVVARLANHEKITLDPGRPVPPHGSGP